MFNLRMLRSCLASLECQFSKKSIPSLQSETAPFKSPVFSFQLPFTLVFKAQANFSSSLNYHFSFFLSLKSKSSTSKFRVAFGGILGGDPWAPYAYSGEQTKVAFSPLRMLAKPSSHPLMTRPCPRTKLKGLSLSSLESKTVPFCREPLYSADISCPFCGRSPAPSACMILVSLPSTSTTYVAIQLDMQLQIMT